MVKLFGILLAVIGCTAMGLLKAADIKDRRRLLLDFKDLMLRISTEISYFKEPLPQIFERLAASLDENRETGLLLRNCLAGYMTENRDMGKQWKEAVSFVYAGLSVTAEDLEILQSCGNFLGQSDFARQQEHFALFHQKLDCQLSQAEEMIHTKGKMYKRLGLSAGVMIAVVMI